MSLGSFKNVIYKMCLQIIYLIYLYKEDLALKIYKGWYAIKPNQAEPNHLWRLVLFLFNDRKLITALYNHLKWKMDFVYERWRYVQWLDIKKPKITPSSWKIMRIWNDFDAVYIIPKRLNNDYQYMYGRMNSKITALYLVNRNHLAM